MQIDPNRLEQFEHHLNPQNLSHSPIPASVLGFGEISAIFKIDNDSTTAFKRMPLFPERSAAEAYARKYKEYCLYLKEAGLTLPEDKTHVLDCPGRPVVLYIAQQQFPKERFVHRLIHHLDEKEIRKLLEKIVISIESVWEFNRTHKLEVELSLDGQISNWALSEGKLYYVDTSTPLYRKSGIEQMNPEPLLRSAPGFLRWILRLFFLDDVMTRYYSRQKVYIDLAANLYKEQRPDLIPLTLDVINSHLPSDEQPLSTADVDKYYKEDKLIWTLFLAFRRIDRWITTRLLCRRYEFILPGKIER